MTENTTLPSAQRDGKAQAVAEKAYRKALRPWFKKKRVILPLALVLLIIFVSLSGGNKEDNQVAAVVETAGVAPAAVEPAAAEPAAVPAAPAPEAEAAVELVSVDAATMLADFNGNEAAADAKYKDKVLLVTGNVEKVDTELLDKDQYIVRLDDGAPYSFVSVNCHDVPAAMAATVVPDSTVTVKGTFKDGGDLGVELKGCEVLP